MRRVDFEQGSQAWLDWRKNLLTATDAAMLMGASPYATPYKGWQRKLGLVPEQPENEAMRRGKKDEPILREWFIKEYGLNMTPWCVESSEYNFIGASLDGITDDDQYILEIKSNGDQYHYGLNGGLPDFHMMQMQHQFLSTDLRAKKGFYLSGNRGDKRVVEVNADMDWLRDYLIKAREYWRKIVFREAPELCSKDFKDMSHAPRWNGFAYEYLQICEQIEKLDHLKENYRNELIKLSGDDSCIGGGIKVIRKLTKGRVDYDSIPELKEVDLNKYRKPSSSSWCILKT